MTAKTKSLGLLAQIVFTGLMMIFSLGIAVAGGEIFLRIVYHDAGTTTMRGPGGKSFIHNHSTKNPHRGPRAKGPKKEGVYRVLVQGDSITFGWGVAKWKDLYLIKGAYEMTFRLKTSDMINKAIALLEIKSHGKVIASQTISGTDFTARKKWENFTISFDATDKLDKNVGFDIHYLGGADLSFSRVELPIDYGIETIDLTASLAGFNSRVSLFDAHPNQRAHKVMATRLYQQIMGESF